MLLCSFFIIRIYYIPTEEKHIDGQSTEEKHIDIGRDYEEDYNLDVTVMIFFFVQKKNANAKRLITI